MTPQKLGRAVRREIENPRNDLYLSPISIWELGRLARRGQFRAKSGLSVWIDQALTRVPVKDAALNFAVGTQAALIQLPESDPGDVILAATACVYSLTLITNDHQLLACRWLKTLAND